MSDQTILNAPTVFIAGKIVYSNGLNEDAKSPIVFTTNRNVTTNGWIVVQHFLFIMLIQYHMQKKI